MANKLPTVGMAFDQSFFHCEVEISILVAQLSLKIGWTEQPKEVECWE